MLDTIPEQETKKLKAVTTRALLKYGHVPCVRVLLFCSPARARTATHPVLKTRRHLNTSRDQTTRYITLNINIKCYMRLRHEHPAASKLTGP